MVEHKEGKMHHVKHHAVEASNPAHSPQHPHSKDSEGKKEKEFKITLALPELKGVNLHAITTIAAVVLLVIVVFQVVQAFTLSQKLDAMTAEAREQSRPAEIQLTSIEADCDDCTPLAGIISSVEAAKVSITKRQALSQNNADAQQLITKYGIKRLPTVIVTGEVDKASLSGFTKADDALVYSQTPPPYVDAATGQVKGLVTLTYVNVSRCNECPDLTGVVQQLKAQVKVKEVKFVDYGSSEGSKVTKEYDMLRLPGILLSSDINEYPLADQLAQIGAVKKDGFIALGANPPYLNVSTGKVAGIVQLILLNDSSCAGCYDVTMHIPIVRRFQINPAEIKVVDAAGAEGKELVSKYKITAVPTLLVTGDVSPYEQLLAIWPTVGTTEKDGALVFRTMSAIAGRPYKDLATGKLNPNIPPQQAQQQ